MDSLPWVSFQQFQFVPNTKEHTEILKATGASYCKVSDVLVTKRPPEIGKGSFLYADEAGLNKYEFKRFLMSRYLNTVSPVAQEEDATQEEDVNLAWDTMIRIWRKHQWPFTVDGTRKVTAPFNPEMFAYGIQFGFVWDLDMSHAFGWTLYFANRQLRIEEAYGISWNVDDYEPWKTCISTPAVRAQLPPALWNEVAGIILLSTKEHDITFLRDYTTMVKKIRDATAAFELNIHKKEVEKRHPPKTLLANSNFYTLVAEQMERNAGQMSFCFSPLADPVEDAVFCEALKHSASFKRCDVIYSSMHLVSSREKNIYNEEKTTGASIMAGTSYILFGVSILLAIIVALSTIALMGSKNNHEAMQILCGSITGLLVCGILGCAHVVIFHNFFIRNGKTLVLNPTKD